MVCCTPFPTAAIRSYCLSTKKRLAFFKLLGGSYAESPDVYGNLPSGHPSVRIRGAAEVKTDYFTLNLPSGWTQPQPVQSAQGATMAILQNAAEQTVVTVAVTPVPLSAKDLATQTLTNMKAAGFTVSEPVASGDSYMGEFSKEQVKGISYFSADGKLGSVITIMGASLDAGKKMLKDNLKPVDSKLFPTDF